MDRNNQLATYSPFASPAEATVALYTPAEDRASSLTPSQLLMINPSMNVRHPLSACCRRASKLTFSWFNSLSRLSIRAFSETADSPLAWRVFSARHDRFTARRLPASSPPATMREPIPLFRAIFIFSCFLCGSSGRPCQFQATMGANGRETSAAGGFAHSDGSVLFLQRFRASGNLGSEAARPASS